MPGDGPETDLVEAFLAASRALVAVAVRSLAGIEEEITLTQYRALVVLHQHGAQRVGDLAAQVGVGPSTASRTVERLVRKGLVERERAEDDRRVAQVGLTDAGGRIVQVVMARRRSEIATILAAMPGAGRAAALEALRSFAAAAGEVPEQSWSAGWDEVDE